MKRYANFLIIESKKEFDSNYCERLQTLANGYIKEIPKTFPICYKFIHGYAYDYGEVYYRGQWLECNINEALGDWNKRANKILELVKEANTLFATKS